MFLEAFNCKFDEAILHKPPEPKQLRWASQVMPQPWWCSKRVRNTATKLKGLGAPDLCKVLPISFSVHFNVVRDIKCKCWCTQYSINPKPRTLCGGGAITRWCHNRDGAASAWVLGWHWNLSNRCVPSGWGHTTHTLGTQDTTMPAGWNRAASLHTCYEDAFLQSSHLFSLHLFLSASPIRCCSIKLSPHAFGGR